MTTAALPHVHPALAIDEIEAWLLEVGPIVRTLAPRSAEASPGRRRWLAAQVRQGAEALVLLEHEVYEAEAIDAPTHELHWLHVRVAALVEAARPRSLAAAA